MEEKVNYKDMHFVILYMGLMVAVQPHFPPPQPLVGLSAVGSASHAQVCQAL